MVIQAAGLLVKALQGEEGNGGADKGGVVVPAWPGAAFVLVETETGFDFEVVMRWRSFAIRSVCRVGLRE